MFKKGFISSYFLYLLIILISIVSVYLLSISYKLKSLKNIEVSNEYLNQEIIITNFIKCNIGEISEGKYTLDNIEIDILKEENSIIVNVYTAYNEKIIYYIENNLILYYDSFTSDDISI